MTRLVRNKIEVIEGILSEDELYNLWMLFHMTRNVLHKARMKELAEYGITPVQSVILHIIDRLAGKATQSYIARVLFRESHTVSKVLDGMEKKGLIAKSRDPDRKNLIRIALAEEGTRIHQRASQRKTVHEIILALSEKERQELRSHLTILMEKALGVLEEYSKPRFLPFWHQDKV